MTVREQKTEERRRITREWKNKNQFDADKQKTQQKWMHGNHSDCCNSLNKLMRKRASHSAAHKKCVIWIWITLFVVVPATILHAQFVLRYACRRESSYEKWIYGSNTECGICNFPHMTHRRWQNLWALAPRHNVTVLRRADRQWFCCSSGAICCYAMRACTREKFSIFLCYAFRCRLGLETEKIVGKKL